MVGVLQLDLHIGEARSLKDKRRVVKSLKERLRHRFNVSVAEVDHHDAWQRCAIAVALVSKETRHVRSELDKVVDVVRATAGAILIDYSVEMY